MTRKATVSLPGRPSLLRALKGIPPCPGGQATPRGTDLPGWKVAKVCLLGQPSLLRCVRDPLPVEIHRECNVGEVDSTICLHHLHLLPCTLPLT
jgi:hypothetical protein